MYKIFDLGTEVSKSEFNEESRCPLCGLGNGVLCPEHVKMTKDYNKIMKWINNQDEINENMKYVIEFSIRDRISLIIENVGIVNNHLAIQEYLDKKKCSEFMERILKEIQALERGRIVISKKLNGG